MVFGQRLAEAFLRQQRADGFLEGFGRGGQRKSAQRRDLGKAVAGPSDMQDVLFPARARLEHPHEPLAHHKHAGARLVFAENDLSLAELAEPGDRGQAAESPRLDLGKQLAAVQNVDNVHDMGGEDIDFPEIRFFATLDPDQGRILPGRV